MIIPYFILQLFVYLAPLLNYTLLQGRSFVLYMFVFSWGT